MNLILMNLVLRQSVFSHIMHLGWTWGENLLLSMSTIWLYYNSLTEQLLSLSCWAKCSLCVISLNHYSKTFGTVTALFPTLQSVLYKQMVSTKERSKMGNWKFCRQFGFSQSLCFLLVQIFPTPHHGFLGNRIFVLWPLPVSLLLPPQTTSFMLMGSVSL